MYRYPNYTCPGGTCELNTNCTRFSAHLVPARVQELGLPRDAQLLKVLKVPRLQCEVGVEGVEGVALRAGKKGLAGLHA